MSLTFDSFVAGVADKFQPMSFEMNDEAGTVVEFRRVQMLPKKERTRFESLVTTFATDTSVFHAGVRALEEGLKEVDSEDDVAELSEAAESLGDQPSAGRFAKSALRVLAHDKAAFGVLEQAIRGLEGDEDQYWEELFDKYYLFIGAKGADLGE